MSKGITLEIPETEAADLELALDDLLKALRRLDDEHDERWERISRLKAETHAMMQQIRSQLHVEESL
jgi:chromosome segregation ATPase